MNNQLQKGKKLAFFVLAAAFVFASCKSQQQVSQLDETEEERSKEVVPDQVPMDQPEKAMEEPKAPTNPVAPAPKPTKEQQLDKYLGNVATAPNISAANQTISETMSMFSSPDATVLLIFYESNGQASYDEPTTISKYLNYLKDTNNPAASVEEIVLDQNGKIKELILKK